MNTTIKTVLVVFVLLCGLFLATYSALYVGVSYIMRNEVQAPSESLYVPQTTSNYLLCEGDCLSDGLERLK